MPLTAPMLQWARAEQISPNKSYKLAREGEVDTVMVEGRRCVILESWAAYVDRQRRGLARDAHEKAAAIERYRKTADASLVRYGASIRPRRRTVPRTVSTTSETALLPGRLDPRSENQTAK
jgi:hypothetical protein